MIKPKIVYETDDKQFESVAKAINYREEKVLNFVEQMLLNGDVKRKAVIEATKHILANRTTLRELLDFSSDPNQFEVYDENGRVLDDRLS